MTLFPTDVGVIRQSPIYDLLMRLPMTCWAMCLAVVSFANLFTFWRQHNAVLDLDFVLNLIARLAAFAFLVLLAASTLTRMRPLGRARGLEPRASALLGTLLPSSFVLFPGHDLSPFFAAGSALIVATGSGLSVYSLAQLGRSFSVMPESRRLITSGIYRFVRHPLYLAETIATAGICVQVYSVWTTLLLVGEFAIQIRRMCNEEILLADTFPAYRAYQERTAMLIPGLY